jgi:hypothetical protein
MDEDKFRKKEFICPFEVDKSTNSKPPHEAVLHARLQIIIRHLNM